MELMSDRTKIAEPQSRSDFIRVRELIRKDGSLIQYLYTESIEMIEAAMEQDPLNLCFIRNQTNKINISAVDRNVLAFPMVDKQTHYLCKLAIKKSPIMKKFASFECLDIPITRNLKRSQGIARRIDEIDEVSERYQSLSHWGFHFLEFLSDQPESFCEAAIKANPFHLAYIKEQNEHLCELAVTQNGNALKLVDRQTEDLCKKAVMKNGLALRYVKNHTPEIEWLAVKENPMAYFYVENIVPEIQRLAVSGNYRILEAIQHPSTELIEIAERSKEFNEKKIKHLYELMPILYNHLTPN